jgi:type III restriction enzyme
MQLKLDANLDFQLDAIRAVVNLFKGMGRRTVDLAREYGYDIVSNLAPGQFLYESDLLTNLRAVQDANRIPKADREDELKCDDGMVLEVVGNDSVRYSSFTIEMETGTGKTYVYLRTICELNKEYGFRKFIIVVPSIAIFEGVIKNFAIAKSHFAALYRNPIIHLTRYEGDRLSNLRSFATSPFIEVLVITLASFNSANNVIFKPSEKLPGERLPHQYIRETRPILILDEPQNMGSETAKAALRTLNPLFGLRYSATHRESPNLVHRLTPFEAFQRGLVKRIQVKGITYRENFNQPFLVLEEVITRRGARPVAKVRTFVQAGDSPKEDTVTLNHGDDLHSKTHRPEHKDGYVVREISTLRGEDPFVDFENGVRLTTTDSMGPVRRDLFRLQIRHTIERHMELQERLKPRGIKGLSLFFIDRVANYQDDDGIIKSLFDEEFNRIKGRFPDFKERDPPQVRSGYFAKRRDKKTGEEVAIDTPVDEAARRNEEIREAEKEAFQLIMRDKERLLSFEEPVAFIFAHSALKEGWDNPNIFQICTLNQTVSHLKKRQEIGRGLRICVNQEGKRVFGSEVNVLTVVANESYERYAGTLQSEYLEEGHAEAPPEPTNADREPGMRVADRYALAEFREFWEKLFRRARYRINIDTEQLIHRCVERLNNRMFPRPILVVQEGEYVKTTLRLTLKHVEAHRARIEIHIEDTRGLRNQLENWHEKDADLEREDPRLRGFRISEIVEDGDASYVGFGNEKELNLDSPIEFETHEGQRVCETAELAEQEYYPVFNLLDRVVNAVGLTRRTVLRIFQQMDGLKKAQILKNPEGFTAVFLNTIRNTMADHVAEKVQFELDPEAWEHSLEKLFPPTRTFPQREVIDTPRHGLYTRTQVDSDVEKRFATSRLEADGQVVCFFKFPPDFKLKLPKIIGNYNPDWGVLRRSKAAVVMELVRETKGDEELARLQFPHEQRKIQAAKRYFREVGVDYRHVSDKTADWYLPASEIAEQAPLLEPGSAEAKPALRIFPIDDPITWDEAFKTMLPLYSLKAAAGYFGGGELVEPEGWVRVERAGTLDDKMFVARAVGRSMEPRIHDGDFCVFRADVVGSREGKIVLVQYRGPEDPETGGSYTVKKYSSEMAPSEEDSWRHTRIILSPLNTEYEPMVLTPESEDHVQVVGELLNVLGSE